MWKMTFEIFIKSLRFETPWVRKNGFYENLITLDKIIGLNWALAYCQNRKIFCVFEKNFVKKSKIQILVSESSHKSLLIILTTFFDLTKIRKIKVC